MTKTTEKETKRGKQCPECNRRGTLRLYVSEVGSEMRYCESCRIVLDWWAQLEHERYKKLKEIEERKKEVEAECQESGGKSE